MTTLLEQAISKVRQLPEADDEAAAEMLFAIAAKRSEPIRLDSETRRAVEEGLEQARRGEFASEEDVAALFASDRT